MIPTPTPVAPARKWAITCWLQSLALAIVIGFAGGHIWYPPSPPAPTPTPAPDIKPIPTPVPPTPVPVPDPAPIADAGLRVMIVYESADLSKYTGGQVAAIYDQSLRDYLDAACVKGADSRTPDWRIYDKDVDLSHEFPVWQTAMKRSHPTLPWILISNGKTGFEGPLPADSAAIKSLVGKYEVKP